MNPVLNNSNEINYHIDSKDYYEKNIIIKEKYMKKEVKIYCAKFDVDLEQGIKIDHITSQEILDENQAEKKKTQESLIEFLFKKIIDETKRYIWVNNDCLFESKDNGFDGYLV